MNSSGLSQSRRPVQKNMIQGLSPEQGSLDENLQILNDFVLTREIFEVLWSDLTLKITIFGSTLCPGVKIIVIHTARKHKYKYRYSFLKIS